LLGSAEARKLDEFAPLLQQLFPRPTPPAMLRRRDDSTAIYGPVGLFEAVTTAGPKGRPLPRYKGLRAVKPEPRWEAPPGVHARSLVEVSGKELDEANTRFDELMGANVQPRRVFIEQNALYASVDV